jgi:hypothetical protein
MIRIFIATCLDHRQQTRKLHQQVFRVLSLGATFDAETCSKMQDLWSQGFGGEVTSMAKAKVIEFYVQNNFLGSNGNRTLANEKRGQVIEIVSRPKKSA